MKGKKCNYCKKFKLWRDLVRNIKYPDGYLPLCKKCKALKNRESKKEILLTKYEGEWLGSSALYL